MADRDIRFPSKEDVDNPDGYIAEERRPIVMSRDERRAVRKARVDDVRQQRRERVERKMQARELKLRDKELRKAYYKSYLPDLSGFGGVGSPYKSISGRMKKLQRAYDNIGKKEYKFDLDRNIGGLGHKNFTLHEPKLKTYDLGSNDLNLSFGDSRFDGKSKRRKKYDKRHKGSYRYKFKSSKGSRYSPVYMGKKNFKKYRKTKWR